MNKLIQLAKSRTAWTAVVMYLITFAPVIKTWIPDQWKPTVDAILTLLVFYFHLNPRQQY